MKSYSEGTRKHKKEKKIKKCLKKNHMVDRYEIKNNTSWAKHGKLTHSDPSLITRKLCYRKDDRAMRPIHVHGPLKFSGLPDYAHGYYSQHFSWAFVLIHLMNVPSKFEIRSFTRSWNNRGYPKNLCSPWIRPRSLFSKIINGLLFGLAL